MINIALLPGDGAGSEVLEGPVGIMRILAERGHLSFTGPWPIGATAFRDLGVGLPQLTIDAVDRSDAILLGAVGEHPGVDLALYRPELALLEIRKRYDLRISIRQVWRPGREPITFIRNLLGGAYGGAEMRQESDGENQDSVAWDKFQIEKWRISEICEIAHEYLKESAEIQFISVDKANLLATSRLWRRTVTEFAKENNLLARHVYVDRFAYEIGSLQLPNCVVVTEGLFGDILSDLASGRAGSIAMCGSASIHPGLPLTGNCVGLFEPVHGSAPKRAGQNQVNPIGGYLALAALLEWFPETRPWGAKVREAVALAMSKGRLTYDLSPIGSVAISTSEFSEIVNSIFGTIVQ